MPLVLQSWDYPVISLYLNSQQSWSLRFDPLHASIMIWPMNGLLTSTNLRAICIPFFHSIWTSFVMSLAKHLPWFSVSMVLRIKYSVVIKRPWLKKYQKPQEKDFQKLPSAMKSSVPPQQPQKLSDARLIVSISTSLWLLTLSRSLTLPWILFCSGSISW